MTNQNQTPNQSQSSSKGGQSPPQSHQADDAHTNSSRAGERPDQSQEKRPDANRKASNQPPGGVQTEPDRARQGNQQANQGSQGQKGSDPSRAGR